MKMRKWDKNFLIGLNCLALLCDISAIIQIFKGRWDIAAVLLIAGMQIVSVKDTILNRILDKMEQQEQFEKDFHEPF